MPRRRTRAGSCSAPSIGGACSGDVAGIVAQVVGQLRADLCWPAAARCGGPTRGRRQQCLASERSRHGAASWRSPAGSCSASIDEAPLLGRGRGIVARVVGVATRRTLTPFSGSPAMKPVLVATQRQDGPARDRLDSAASGIRVELSGAAVADSDGSSRSLSMDQSASGQRRRGSSRCCRAPPWRTLTAPHAASRWTRPVRRNLASEPGVVVGAAARRTLTWLFGRAAMNPGVAQCQDGQRATVWARTALGDPGRGAPRRTLVDSWRCRGSVVADSAGLGRSAATGESAAGAGSAARGPAAHVVVRHVALRRFENQPAAMRECRGGLIQALLPRRDGTGRGYRASAAGGGRRRVSC